mmetsp:Transcript_4413/g.11578  ORF Transcript_4413/g.11578 Transcript_4413/m.11578 type:complete len:234 (+) Transcript_4413:638-1339(+)
MPLGCPCLDFGGDGDEGNEEDEVIRQHEDNLALLLSWHVAAFDGEKLGDLTQSGLDWVLGMQGSHIHGLGSLRFFVFLSFHKVLCLQLLMFVSIRSMSIVRSMSVARSISIRVGVAIDNGDRFTHFVIIRHDRIHTCLQWQSWCFVGPVHGSDIDIAICVVVVARVIKFVVHSLRHGSAGIGVALVGGFDGLIICFWDLKELESGAQQGKLVGAEAHAIEFGMCGIGTGCSRW